MKMQIYLLSIILVCKFTYSIEDDLINAYMNAQAQNNGNMQMTNTPNNFKPEPLNTNTPILKRDFKN